MSNIKYTKQQQDIINHDNGNLLVSASAGTGKTTVLVERIIKLLSNGTELPQMAVMTFTRAAAAEMKERLRNKIISKIKDNKNDKDKLALWRNHLNSIAAANISTIDSFCNNVIRENIEEIGIEYNFEIMDTIEEEILIDKVLDDIIGDYCEDQESRSRMQSLLTMFSGKPDFKGLKDLLNQIYKYCGTLPFSKTKFLVPVKEIYANKITDLKNLSSLTFEAQEMLKLLFSAIDEMKKVDVSNKKAKAEAALRKKDANASLDEAKIKKITGDIDKEYLDKLNEQYENSDSIVFLIEVVEKFIDELLSYKTNLNKYSFSDLEQFVLNIFYARENGEEVITKTAKKYRNQFKYVMVDEYQDINAMQEYIILAISGHDNLFMVGDVKQSIYGFRHARPDIFIDKKEKYNNMNSKQLMYLTENFRSDKKILDYVNNVCEKVSTKSKYIYNKPELLVSGLPANSKRSVDDLCGVNEVYLSNTSDTDPYKVMKCADYICKQIKSMMKKDSNLRYGDFTVLLRSLSSPIKDYVYVFEKNNVPFTVEKGNSFLNNIYVRILVDFLHLIDNEYLDLELASVLMSFIGKLTADDLLKIRLTFEEKLSFHKAVHFYAWYDEQKEKNKPEGEFCIKDLIVNKKYYEPELANKIRDILRLIREFRAESAGLSLYDLINLICNRLNILLLKGSRALILSTNDAIKQLLYFAQEYSGYGIYGLGDFLRFLDKIKESDGSLTRSSPLSSDMNAVRIMTIHASKGLEFPYVFYADVAGTVKIKASSVAVNPKFGLGIKNIDIEQKVNKSDSIFKEIINDENKSSEREEEYRLMYVAMTRAKKGLFVIGYDCKESSDYIFYLYNDIKSDSWWDKYEKLKAKEDNDTITDIEKKELENERKIVDNPIETEYGSKIYYVGDLRGQEFIDFYFSNESNLDKNSKKNAAGTISDKDLQDKVQKIIKGFDYDYLNEHKNADKPYKISVTKYSRLAKEMLNEEGEVGITEFNYGELQKKDNYLENQIDVPDDMFDDVSDKEILNVKNRNASKIKDVSYIPFSMKLGSSGTEYNPMKRGTLIHKILEKWDFQGEYKGADDVEKYVLSLEKKGVNLDSAITHTVYEDIYEFTKCELYQKMKLADRDNLLFREQQFVYVLNADYVYNKDNDLSDDNQEIVVEGIIDAYFIEGDKIVVVDYKTDKSEDKEYYRKAYKHSIGLYAEVLAKTYGKEVSRQLVYSLKIGEVEL